MRRPVLLATAVAGLTGIFVLGAVGTASAVTGQPLIRYVDATSPNSIYFHWTTTDPSQLPAEYQGNPDAAPFGYTVDPGPGTVPLLSCTWTASSFGAPDGETLQYLSVGPDGCTEDGAVAATLSTAYPPLTTPTITTVATEGSIYVSPPADGTPVHALYRCVTGSGAYLATEVPPGDDGFCGEAPDGAPRPVYEPDELLGYLADAPSTAPSDLPEVPVAALLPLAAFGVLTGGMVLSRLRSRRAL